MGNKNKLDRLSWLVYQTIDTPKTLFKKEWHMLILNCSNFICRESLQVGFTGRLTEPDGETGYQRSIDASGILEDGNRIQLIGRFGFGLVTESLAVNFRPLSEIKEETDESLLLGLGDPEEIDLEEAEEFLHDGGVIYPAGFGDESEKASDIISFQAELGVPDKLFDTFWDRVFEDQRIDLAYLCLCIHAFSDDNDAMGSLAQDKVLALEDGLNLACMNFLRLDKYSINGPDAKLRQP